MVEHFCGMCEDLSLLSSVKRSREEKGERGGGEGEGEGEEGGRQREEEKKN